MSWSRTAFPEATRARSVTCWPPLKSSESESSESESSEAESESGSSRFKNLALLCNIRQTVVIRHAFVGSTRRRRRQCQRLFAIPMLRSTVVLVELWEKLQFFSFLVVGLERGVISQSLSMYPLSPNRYPLTGLSLLSKASNRADSRRIRESCTQPGHFAMTLMNSKSESHTTCTKKERTVKITAQDFTKSLFLD